jgi:hypothetical protein
MILMRLGFVLQKPDYTIDVPTGSVWIEIFLGKGSELREDFSKRSYQPI